jgi:UDP-2,3-diacylglucosamine pyrophosphatase LpxH
MSKKHYRSIFISDTHLCSRDCRSDYLLSFLKHHKAEYLYLVGDIIDVWQLRRRWYWPQAINNVFQKILSRAKKGTTVTYIPGNHDECLRPFVGNTFGDVRLINEAIHTTADGKRLLVLHGDVFDAAVQHNRWLALVGDHAYTWLIRANGIFNFFRRRLNLPYWSLSGYVKGKVKNAISYISKFEDVVIGYARKESVDGVICGHIHQPKIREIDGFTYYNTGDWIENCTALVEHDDGRFELIHWIDAWPAVAQEHDEEEEEKENPRWQEHEIPIPVLAAVAR